MSAHAAPAVLADLHCREILGSPVASLEWEEGLALLRRLIAERAFTKVTFLNAHNVNIAARDAEFAAALGEFLILPDGIGVDIAARLLYGAPFPANLNGTDFVPALLAAEKRPLSVGLIGAKRESAETAVKKLSVLAPQHRFTFINDGFFTPDEEPGILARIEELRPDILVVAMGVPRQELWISRNITERHCTIPIAVGALLDFLSGAVPRAPEWMRRLRIEWVYRLYQEPKRLWRRYILGNPAFLARILVARYRRQGQER